MDIVTSLERHASERGETTELGMDLIAAAQVITRLTTEAQCDKEYMDSMRSKIAELTRERDEARAKAIEEAAQVADEVPMAKLIQTSSVSHDLTFWTGAKAQSTAIAAAIRKLRETGE